MGLASLLVAFTGGVYYVSMNKLKQARGTRARWFFLRSPHTPDGVRPYAQTDDLSELEGKVNAHQSGLKLDRGAADFASPASVPAEKPKQTGWRRVVFFWR